MSGSNASIIGNYKLENIIGKGTFGKVYKATHLTTQSPVAIKILDKKLIVQDGDIQRVSRQIKILRKIKHQNVIQLYEIIETETHLHLITQLAEQDLFTSIVRRIRFTQSEAATLFRQLLLGLQYCHDNNICHRDIKPENLLLSNFQIKITDFGLSNMFQKDELLKTACGSPCYAPPQMLEKKMYCPKLVDVWSSGVTLYTMVFGMLPFDDPNILQLYKKIKKGDFRIPKQASEDLRHLLQQVLQIDPKKRPSIGQILEHPWLKEAHLVKKQQQYIQRQLIDKVSEIFGFDKDALEHDLINNRHNNLTTTYYLSSFVRKADQNTPKHVEIKRNTQTTPSQSRSFINEFLQNTPSRETINPLINFTQKQNKQPNPCQQPIKLVLEESPIKAFVDIRSLPQEEQDVVPRPPPQQIKQTKPAVITLRKVQRMKTQFMKKTATKLYQRSVSRPVQTKHHNKSITSTRKPIAKIKHKIIEITRRPQIMSSSLFFIGKVEEFRSLIQRLQFKQCQVQYWKVNQHIIYISSYSGNVEKLTKELNLRLKI